jgi:hypothetical protein
MFHDPEDERNVLMLDLSDDHPDYVLVWSQRVRESEGDQEALMVDSVRLSPNNVSVLVDGLVSWLEKHDFEDEVTKQWRSYRAWLETIAQHEGDE